MPWECPRSNTCARRARSDLGRWAARQASLRARSGGFTLLELVAVVLIITVFAALALPTAVGQLRSRRVQEAARQIGIVYREARLRALGRGSAILVRIQSGDITIHEAMVGTGVGGDADCALLPVSSCVTPLWSQLDQQRVIGGFHIADSGETANMAVALTDSNNTAVTTLDICFTPMGRAFARQDIADTTPFTPLAQTYVASVSRTGSRTRQLVLMPNGTARMF